MESGPSFLSHPLLGRYCNDAGPPRSLSGSWRDNARMETIAFELRGEFITLDNLLKATGLAPSGGSAKQMIAEGLVQVDGAVELRKTCKIRAGQQVSCAEGTVSVAAG